jgi:hypothetical protein
VDKKFTDGVIAVMVAIVGLATTAVFFSKQADTANVLTSGGNAFAAVIKAAVGPVSGGI